MKALIERLLRSRPVRAWLRYTQERGPVLAQGMTMQAFLSLFASLFLGFAVFMAVLGDNEELREGVIGAISAAVPGLIGDGGVVDVETLTGSAVLGWAGVVAGVSILLTAIAWVAVSREGFRAMFELEAPPSNFLLLKLGDLGVGLGIGVLVVVSAGVLIVAQGLAEALGLDWATQLLAFGVQLLLDATVVLLLFRVGGRLRLPAKHMVVAALTCAVAFAGLKLVASILFRGVEHNPLLAGVAAPVILLLWLGFIMQILLVVLAFVAVGPTGRAYTRLVRAGGIDATLSRAEAEALLEEVRAERADSADVVRLHKRLARGR